MITPDKLAQVKDFDSLAALFYEELDWPSQQWQTFDGVAKLYDIELTNAKSIQAVQPLDPDLEWGIFLLDFGSDPLKRKDLRTALTKLAEKNRQQHDNPVWHHEKLLFICRYTPADKGNRRDAESTSPGTSGVPPDDIAFTFAYFTGEKLANAKLRTFGWDDPKRARTAITRNLPALHWDKRQNWQAAWDAEALTKEFFKDYKAVFEKVEESVVGLDTDEDKRRFTQTLFNRLMFIAFLQEKGWLEIQGEKKDYLHRLFNPWQPDQGKEPEKRFYDRLRYLFFSGLNSPNGQGGEKFLEKRIGKVPFLNGGLFEKHDVLDRDAIHVPDDSIKEILALFQRYTFTVTESTPLDVEVALDPEMLGKIFEELVTGRHESGSYYTPRPVVQFMCREGLKGYLGGHEKLIDEYDTDGIGITEAKEIIQKLESVKVCDPACGSGAYLLGMLQEIHTLQVLLDTTAEQKDARDDYARKIKIIRDCLYGVDIDQFAVNIAWLRLWLALVIDDERDQIHDDVSLPNLDVKVMVGDSLTGVGPRESSLAAQIIPDYKKQRNHYIRAHTKADKELYRKEMEESRKAIRGFLKVIPHQGALDWSVDFIDALMAEDGSRSGFDIVLANPPYVRHERIKQSFGVEYQRLLVKAYPDSGSGTADLYIYFYDRALQLLARGGMLVFITSNKWFKAGYGEKLRKHMAEQATILSITDFGELPVFETAATFPMIFVAKKEKVETQSPTFTQVKSLAAPYPDVATLIAEQGAPLPHEAINGANWTLADAQTIARIEKMKASGVPLGEHVGGKIYRGILTGFNEAFVIDGAKRAELIAEDPKSAEIIKPLAVGDDIRRWHIRKRDRWLIVTKIGVDVGRYPAVMKHLSKWEPQLKKRQDQGNHWWELRACAYYAEFDKPKIGAPDICKMSRFAMAAEGTHVEATGTIIASDEKYLLGVCNSTCAWQFFQDICSVLGDPGRGGRIRLKLFYLRALPIPLASTADRDAIAALVQKCLDAKAADPEADVSEFEAEIDKRVEFLYFHRSGTSGVSPDRDADSTGQNRRDGDSTNYDQWLAQQEAEKGTVIEEIRSLLKAGESAGVEFKSSLEAPDMDHPTIANAPDSQKPAKIAEGKKNCIHSVLKTIGAFRNRKEGGTLLIGAWDSGDLRGLQDDYELLGKKKDKDGFENKLTDLIKTRINPIPTDLDIRVVPVDGKEVCLIKVPHGKPTYVDNKLYVRLGNSTEELTGRDQQDWLDD